MKIGFFAVRLFNVGAFGWSFVNCRRHVWRASDVRGDYDDGGPLPPDLAGRLGGRSPAAGNGSRERQRWRWEDGGALIPVYDTRLLRRLHLSLVFATLLLQLVILRLVRIPEVSPARHAQYRP